MILAQPGTSEFKTAALFILAAPVNQLCVLFAKTASSCLPTPIAHTVCAVWTPTQLLKTWEYQISPLTSVERTADVLCKSGVCIFWDLNLFVLKNKAGSKVCSFLLDYYKKLKSFFDFCQHLAVCSQKGCVSISGPEPSQNALIFKNKTSSEPVVDRISLLIRNGGHWIWYICQ